MGKVNKNKPVYVQHFRPEWKKELELRDWIVEIPAAPTKARCRFCKCDLTAKHKDLLIHSQSAKHKTAAEPFSSQRQKVLEFPKKSDDQLKAEVNVALFVCAHCAISTCDHLNNLCKSSFPDSKIAHNLKIHRTKCSELVKNKLHPHFTKDLLADIGDGYYSLLLDESNDISANKFLGIVIIYHSISQGKVISTFLCLEKLDECDAQAIVDATKRALKKFGLDLKKLVGIGTDNASVMVGINNGVYAKLKEELPELILFRCVCHSLQLAVTHASAETLPRHLEYLIAETYNWFSRSATRQGAYEKLFKAINDGDQPLKIPQVSNTRWLSIERAVDRVIDQWTELKTHFSIARNSEKCYAAENLYALYQNELNLAYLLAIKPTLSDVQRVNKSFEAKDADPLKLVQDLTNLTKAIAQRLTSGRHRNVDPLTHDLTDFVDRRAYLGFAAESKLTELRNRGKLSSVDEGHFRDRVTDFLLTLHIQIRQRLPENVRVLEKVSLLSPVNVLNAVKESIHPLFELFDLTDDLMTKIDHQFQNINLIKWTKQSNTVAFWDEVSKYKDASDLNPFKELAQFAFRILVLPYSNAEVERVFSQLNIVKSKLRNKMKAPMVNAILMVRCSLRRLNKCCYNYEFDAKEFEQFAKQPTEKSSSEKENAEDEDDDELLFVF